MNKPGIIFAFVAIYSITAFTWWTIAHIRSSKQLYEQQKINLELICYKATIEVNGGIAQELFNDTADVKMFIQANFPQVEILFIEPENQVNAYDQFLIRPKKENYLTLQQKHNRAVLMYSLEGIVMVLLLIWGIIWIFQSLQSRLNFNRRQNNFMLSITHELKTPLASVKLYLETLLKRSLDKAQTETILKNSLSELLRLRDLVNNILLAAQLENKKFELHKTEINLSEIIAQAVDKYATPRSMQDRFVCDIEQDIFIEGDAIAIELVANNLISNAAKYSSEENKIEVAIKQKSSKVLFIVKDEGQGIADADKKLLFRKFYRSGDEQTRKTRGTGLGLFIVKNLLNLMKAEITVKDNQPKGAIFEITFEKYDGV